MIEFVHPWLFFLLVLPLLIYIIVPAHKENKDSLQVPFFNRLVLLTGEVPRKGANVLKARYIQIIVVAIGWVLLVVATAKPELIGPPVEIKKSARDLMFVVDISGSMAETDFNNDDGNSIARLDAVKEVIHAFVTDREGDRLGFIVFGDAAYLQVPFTDDKQTFLALLDEVEVGMAGQSTAFGDAIGLSISVFQGSKTNHRVLIALTDGNDTGSRVPPVDAAKIALANDVTIYPIAMGDPATIGEEAVDVEILAQIAKETHGSYFLAMDKGMLSRAYLEIDRLEPELYESLSYRPRRSMFHVPLGIFAILICLSIPMYILLGARKRIVKNA